MLGMGMVGVGAGFSQDFVGFVTNFSVLYKVFEEFRWLSLNSLRSSMDVIGFSSALGVGPGLG